MGKSDKNLLFLIVFISFVSILFLSQVFSQDSRIKILNLFRGPLKMVSGTYYALRDVANFKELEKENMELREEQAGKYD